MHLSEEPSPPPWLAEAGSCGDTEMGQAQIWRSRVDNGGSPHFRRKTEFQFSSPHSGVWWRPVDLSRSRHIALPYVAATGSVNVDEFGLLRGFTEFLQPRCQSRV
jgi:hypothetical protein